MALWGTDTQSRRANILGKLVLLFCSYRADPFGKQILTAFKRENRLFPDRADPFADNAWHAKKANMK